MIKLKRACRIRITLSGTIPGFFGEIQTMTTQNMGQRRFLSMKISFCYESFADNHVSILLLLKNTSRIQKESSCDLAATVVLNRGQVVVRRRASRQEVLLSVVLIEHLYSTTQEPCRTSSPPSHFS
jgi:hypothetical protein